VAEHRAKDIAKGLGTIALVIALLIGLICVLYGLFVAI
jgi:hypothetical protein